MMNDFQPPTPKEILIAYLGICIVVVLVIAYAIKGFLYVIDQLP